MSSSPRGSPSGHQGGPWLERSWSSAKLYAALVQLRTKELKDEKRKEKLLKRGLIAKLAYLLDRPNGKIVDVALSILGNLLMEEEPRIQLRKLFSGLSFLADVLTGSRAREPPVLARAARACANAAQDAQTCVLLQADGRLLPALVHLCQTADDEKTKQVVVRAFRILAATPEQKQDAVYTQVIACVSKCLYSEDEELLKATTKCLAHFTHGCNEETAAQLRGEDGGGFDRLVALMTHQKRSVWEAAMATLVNLSHVDSLRPVLGNSGVIVAMVDKLNLIETLTGKEIAHCVTALCLYCRESVNRMKLRNFGGLRLFVHLLGSPEHKALHGRILNSLLQFAYDDMGLKVLLHYGVVPVLIGFLKAHNLKYHCDHDCAEEICRVGRRKDNFPGKEDGAKDDDDDDDDDPDMANQPAEPFEDRSNNILLHPPLACPPVEREVDERDGINFDDEPRGEPSKFRVNSPSYRAVQHEFEAFMRIRGDAPASYEEAEAAVAAAPETSHVYTNPWQEAAANVSSFSMSPENSLCQSPDRSPPMSFLSSSPGYSPAYSVEDGSPGTSPGPSYSYSPHYEPSAPIDAVEGEATYSPVERFSEEEEEEEEKKAEASGGPPLEQRPPPQPARQTSLSPPPTGATSCSTSSPPLLKRQRKATLPSSPTERKRSMFSPSYEPNFDLGPDGLPAAAFLPSSPPTAGTSGLSFFSQSGMDATSRQEGKSRIGWILQILSRMSQAEKPHEDLMSLDTSLALVDYLCFTSKPLPRAGRVLTRLTKNLYSVMPFARQRTVSHFRLFFASRPTLADTSCRSCKILDDLRCSLETNVSLLAETGYAEGQICHSLMRGSEEEKLSISVSAPMLVRPRKILRNILLTHGGLDVLLDCLEEVACSKKESADAKDEEEPMDESKPFTSTSQEAEHTETASAAEQKLKDREVLLSHAVLSSHSLAGHLGVVSPNLRLQPSNGEGRCLYDSTRGFGKAMLFRLDDGSAVEASRQVMIKESSVFEAMLTGQFVESDQSEVRLPETAHAALLPLVHHLHGCEWCTAFRNLSPAHLLELASLSDRYLLPEFNRSVASEIVLRCLRTSEVVGVYAGSLQGAYVVQGLDETLSSCAVSYLLVGAMPHETRVEVFKELLGSKMKGDFLDDIGKMFRQKLLEKR